MNDRRAREAGANDSSTPFPGGRARGWWRGPPLGQPAGGGVRVWPPFPPRRGDDGRKRPGRLTWAGLLAADGARGLEDGGPSRDFALDELLERGRGPLRLGGDDAAEFEEALAGVLVVKCLVEGVAQLGGDFGGVFFGANTAFHALT